MRSKVGRGVAGGKGAARPVPGSGRVTILSTMSDFTHRVWDVVRQVPRGRVVSYGGVAAILGRPRAARGVGHALSVLAEDSDVPWWRVVNRNGEISIRGPMHGAALQRALL
ncbi:MAG: MGMT family protein, partial [Gemmatimonadota bacterium]